MSMKVGIDFGTSNSGVAYYDGQQVHMLPIDQQNVTPEVVKSILYFTRDFVPYIGQAAVELYYRHNVNRLRRFEKKWVGEIDIYGGDMHYVRDIYAYVDELAPGRLLQFIKTALRSDRYTGTQIFERYYYLSDIIGIYLGELKKRAESILGTRIDAVTLGRPVLFSRDPQLDRQAQATLLQAAQSAGFTQVDFELEPVAAALFYETRLNHPQTTLIFDFGGGTLDVTVLRLGEKGRTEQERTIYASGGLPIAGSDFDRAIIQKRLLTHFGQGKEGLGPAIEELIRTVPDWIALPELSTPQNRQRLEDAIRRGTAPARLKALQSLIFKDMAFSFYSRVELAKIALSSQGVVEILLLEKDLDLWELYSRQQFEKDIQDERQQIEQFLRQTIAASGLTPAQIDAVVKTGGSSNIPVFTELLASIFGPQKIIASDTFSSVTSGLAIRAYQEHRSS